MEKTMLSKAEVIMAGLGGMGVLVAGRLLAWGALPRYKHISWMPTYGEARRGGLSECTVILSDQEIASPILDQAQTVMLWDSSQVKAFESRVRPGGLMIVESAGLQNKPERQDFRLLPVSGLEIAMGLGGVVINNMILLGVYTQVVGPLSAQLIEEELDRRYGDKEAMLKRNKEAFRKGIELGKNVKVQ